LKVQKIKEILEKNINKSKDCKERECKVDKNNIKAIFSPEKDGLKNEKIKNELLNSGNYKACDCIILCENGNIYIIEILCGTLNKKELEDKLKQLNNCKILIKKLNLNNSLKKSYILFKRRDNKTLSTKFFQNKLKQLERNEIFPKPIDKFNQPCS